MMNTKKTLLLLIFIAATHFAQAQKSYYTFSINENIGITDELGNEIIPPSFKYSDNVPKKNEIHLKNYSDTPDIIFNTTTGQKKEYEHIFSTNVKIKGEPFVELKQKNKRYLMSLERNFQINLTRRFSEFTNCGNYILEKYSETVYAKEKPAPPVKKTKSGAPTPPPPIQMLAPPTEVHYFGVINNDEKFTTIKRVKGTSYLPLYKIPEEDVNENGNVLVNVILQNIDLDAQDPFDYIIFSTNKTHNLYDAKMKLIKTFTLANAEDEDLMAFAKKIVNSNLSKYSKHNFPPPPMMAPSSGRNQREEPEIVYPFFALTTSTDGKTRFILQKSKEESHTIFSLNYEATTRLDTKKYRLGFKDKEDKWYFFSFDPKTGIPFLPKAYLNSLGIILN